MSQLIGGEVGEESSSLSLSRCEDDTELDEEDKEELEDIL